MRHLFDNATQLQNGVLIALVITAIIFFWGYKLIREFFSTTNKQDSLPGTRIAYPKEATAMRATPKRKRRTKAEMLAASATTTTAK